MPDQPNPHSEPTAPRHVRAPHRAAIGSPSGFVQFSYDDCAAVLDEAWSLLKFGPESARPDLDDLTWRYGREMMLGAPLTTRFQVVTPAFFDTPSRLLDCRAYAPGIIAVPTRRAKGAPPYGIITWDGTH